MPITDHSQNIIDNSQESNFDSQVSSQSSLMNELQLGRTLLKDYSEPSQIFMANPNEVK